MFGFGLQQLALCDPAQMGTANNPWRDRSGNRAEVSCSLPLLDRHVARLGDWRRRTDPEVMPR